MSFTDAGQAEILRSSQKDEYIVSKLRTDVSDIAQSIFGARLWLKWKQELEILADFVYLSLTTLSDFQTLGEEYVNVIQVDDSKRKIPSKLRRLCMIVFQITTPYLLNRSMLSIENTLKTQTGKNSLSPDIAAKLLDFIPNIRHVVTFLHRFHVTLFYFDGIFYHLSKRMTGIRYLLVRSWLLNKTGRYYFRILGLLSTLQMVMWIILAWQHFNKEDKSNSSLSNKQIDSYVKPDKRCSLCLENRRNCTSTPCGHLFCWNCIVEWAQNKPECPLCREEVIPSRLICLQNYS